MTSRPARTALGSATALLLAGSLAACGTVHGAATPAAPDLATALTPDVAGFSSGDVPAPPETVCHQGNYTEDYVPVLPGSLGRPTAVGYRTEDADLHAWGWRLASADAATAVVDEAVADLGGCSYEIHFDSDTDGDGEIDAGGSEQQSARPFSDDTWTGMSSSGRFYGGGAELVESRFVRSGDVVLLVVLTIHGGGDDSLRSAVTTYLDGVAAELT